jgi:hypothetical protein
MLVSDETEVTGAKVTPYTICFISQSVGLKPIGSNVCILKEIFMSTVCVELWEICH